MLRECSSWASRKGAVQMFFLTPTRNMFLAFFQELIFYDFEWAEVRKKTEVLWATLYCKRSDFFASFGWLWDFLPEHLLQNLRFLIIYFLVQISFLRTLLGHSNKFNFRIFHCRSIMVVDIFTQPSFHKKSSYGPAMLTLPAPCISESYIKLKINLNFCFHTSLWCLK